MLSGLSTSGHLGRVVVGRQQKKLNILNWIEKTNRQNQTNQKRDRAEQKNELYYNSPPLLSTNGSDRHSSLSRLQSLAFFLQIFSSFFSHMSRLNLVLLLPRQQRTVLMSCPFLCIVSRGDTHKTHDPANGKAANAGFTSYMSMIANIFFSLSVLVKDDNQRLEKEKKDGDNTWL